MTPRLDVDLSRSLIESPQGGHNRWHPDIEPALHIRSGDVATIATRDSFDGQITPAMTVADLARIDFSRGHPLTGPIHVAGAEPGDLLAVEVLDVTTAGYGFTLTTPQMGFLRDIYPAACLVHWTIADRVATSRDMPGLRLRAAPFMGVMGVAPSHEQMWRMLEREAALLGDGGAVLPPEPRNAVPPRAAAGLRTLPPRENGGNLDIKQAVAGTTIYFPVAVDGALFSTGDAHFAQGDGEACGCAVEVAATLTARFSVLKGAARLANQTMPSLSRELPLPPSGPFHATTGTCITGTGRNLAEDVTQATRQALANMIEHIRYRYGYSLEQALVVANVAVDLRISQIVNVPNMIVTAFLPTDIFNG